MKEHCCKMYDFAKVRSNLTTTEYKCKICGRIIYSTEYEYLFTSKK